MRGKLPECFDCGPYNEGRNCAPDWRFYVCVRVYVPEGPEELNPLGGLEISSPTECGLQATSNPGDPLPQRQAFVSGRGRFGSDGPYSEYLGVV